MPEPVARRPIIALGRRYVLAFGSPPPAIHVRGCVHTSLADPRDLIPLALARTVEEALVEAEVDAVIAPCALRRGSAT